MAFSGRLGMLVRKSGQASLPSMFNSIRCMSSSKLFIEGLSWGTDDVSLKESFSTFGKVAKARVVTDRETGRSRGFGFVNFTSDESATWALSTMDGQELNGRTIRVSYATDRPSGPRSFNDSYRDDRNRSDY